MRDQVLLADLSHEGELPLYDWAIEHGDPFQDPFRKLRNVRPSPEEKAGWVIVPYDDFMEFKSTVAGLKSEVRSLRLKLAKLSQEGVSTEVIEFRTVPNDEAKNLVLSYVDSHPNARTSEIIEALKLDPDLAVTVLDELSKEGKLESQDVKPTS